MQIDGVPAAHIVVSLITMTSGFSSSLRFSSSAAKFGEPDSSSPSISIVSETGGASCVARGQQGADAERVEEHLALVIGGAAAEDPAVPLLRRERLIVPAVLEGGGLDVMVAVDEHPRAPGSAAGQCA